MAIDPSASDPRENRAGKRQRDRQQAEIDCARAGNEDRCVGRAVA
jgi:hypothetical protein